MILRTFDYIGRFIISCLMAMVVLLAWVITTKKWDGLACGFKGMIDELWDDYKP